MGADYLRCCLLHYYGGIYLDTDTICLRSLVDLFEILQGDYDAVGYDGARWGELIGISDMGPFRPATPLTEAWFNALHRKMHLSLYALQSKMHYPFYWQEILRDIFVPVSVMHERRISTALQAHSPEQRILWSVLNCEDLLGAELDRSHILILNNSKYGHELGALT